MKALKFEILIKLNIAGGVKKILCENKTMLEKMVQSLVNNSLLKNMFVPPSYLKKKITWRFYTQTFPLACHVHFLTRKHG